MKLITAVLREDAVDDVQIALARQGISGMTVTEVSGYAHQRGHTEVYRGEEFTISFITKIRLDILAPDSDAGTIVETICQAAAAATSGTAGLGAASRRRGADRTGEHGEAAI